MMLVPFTSISMLVFAIIILYLEGITHIERVLPLRKFATRVVNSTNLNLAFYEALAVMAAVEFHLLIEESQHPFFVKAFPLSIQVLLGFLFALAMIVVNYVRYERGHTKDVHLRRIYNIAVSYAEDSNSPEAGLEESISVIRKLHVKYPRATERGLLEFLCAREDALGELARQKLRTMQRDDPT